MARASLLLERCDQLAACSEEPGCITRSYGTPALLAARNEIAAWMQAAGLAVRIDAIGNVRGRYAGEDLAAPALLIGSHFDSVRDAGRYDGPLGILAGIAAIERLRDAGRRLPFPIEIIAFPDEEGLRFQTTYLGSRALTGTLEHTELDRRDAGGVTLREAITGCQGDPGALDTCALREDEAFAYVEMHIEQGPYLESIDAPLGVVSAISGQTGVVVTFTGEAGHAGTVAMHLRRDPLPAAAELILAAERLAQDTPGLVATTGRLDVAPGATNVIPGRVELSLDVRHATDAARVDAVASLERLARDVAQRRGLAVDWRVMREHTAVQCDLDLVRALTDATVSAGFGAVSLPSGAGHDAAAMSGRVPVAMLFVRCAGGISHNPAESVTGDDVAAAIETLDRFLDAMADRRA